MSLRVLVKSGVKKKIELVVYSPLLRYTLVLMYLCPE